MTYPSKAGDIYDTTGRFCFDGLPSKEQVVRRPEADQLLGLVKEGQRSYVDGVRRVGKTTLVIHTLEEAKIPVLRFDLEGVASLEKLIERLKNTLRGFFDKFPEARKKIMASEKVKAGIGGNLFGLISMKIEGERSMPRHEVEDTLDSVLGTIDFIARELGAVVFFDEFQAVKNFAIKKPEEIMGSFSAISDPAATRGNVCYLFAGSNRHAMGQIFAGTASRFFQQAHSLIVNPIPSRVINPFLAKRFDGEISPVIANSAYEWTGGIPGDLQRIYSALRRQTGDRHIATKEDFDAAKLAVSESIGRSYSLTLQTLTTNEHLLLDAMADDNVNTLQDLLKTSALKTLGPEAANVAMQKLMRCGLVNVPGLGSNIERPEPILFHYLKMHPAVSHRPVGQFFPVEAPVIATQGDGLPAPSGVAHQPLADNLEARLKRTRKRKVSTSAPEIS